MAASEKTRDAELFAQLDDESRRLLFPERFSEPVTVTLAFPPLAGDQAAAAAPLLQRATSVEEAPDPLRPGNPVVQRVTYAVDRVEHLHALYMLLESEAAAEDVDILVDGKRLPLVRELWLPLFWLLQS